MTPGRDKFYEDRDEPETPWGTGAQTPVKRRDLDDETYELLLDRSRALRRHSFARPPRAPSPTHTELAWSLSMRIGLLFLLGMGYGALVTRLRGEVEGIAATEPQHGWTYLVGWGISGVALGALLPWFDGVWQVAFGNEQDSAVVEEKTADRAASESRSRTDWSHAVRSIGAFVGIIFALVCCPLSDLTFTTPTMKTRGSYLHGLFFQRKLPWVSTLQVSLALTLVNPFLWYLVDRTKPGFILSAAVGVAGSAILIGINPDMMPAPSSPFYHPAEASANVSADPLAAASQPGIFGSQQTLETGIWMLSVLFCSCVCFGNIGRRLALNKSAAVAG